MRECNTEQLKRLQNMEDKIKISEEFKILKVEVTASYRFRISNQPRV